jgi:hypothetical protein
VVGFVGSSTIPRFVTGALVKLASEFLVDQTQSITDAVTRTCAGDLMLLKHTSLVVITKAGSRTLGVTVPGFRAFGVEFRYCGYPGCRSEPGDVVVKTKDQDRRVRLACSRCGWRSLWLAAEQLDFLTSVGPAHPRVFWAPYPLVPTQQLAFIEAEKWIARWTARSMGLANKKAEAKREGKKERKLHDNDMDISDLEHNEDDEE